MNSLFYFGILGLILFEICNVYFIMPMPGSQEMNSIGLAYFLYTWRWAFRVLFSLCIFYKVIPAFQESKILVPIFLLLTLGIVYATNFIMAADKMFLQVDKLRMTPPTENKIDMDKIILGIEHRGETRAYPIQFLGYHHQIFDTLAGKPVIITYCTVCRTGRVFKPIVQGKVESFRLVGMDHFNAMFEDKTTKSWWRQVNGEAIAGPLKGQSLPEIMSRQMSLKDWLALYPNSLIMQEDTSFSETYESMKMYESGKSKGDLTKRDSASWQKKSWIVGVKFKDKSKAYDWNKLAKDKIIHDVLDHKPIVLILSSDKKGFIAFERTNENQIFKLENDSLFDGTNKFNFLGESNNQNIPHLVPLKTYQEYWHSWQTFNPETLRNQ
ncbi:MAG: DUF3179 domain-containing protein [Chitinophagales bacterium]|nr:DUF3179 domain-containing protein [Chitinophagales bacterium]